MYEISSFGLVTLLTRFSNSEFGQQVSLPFCNTTALSNILTSFEKLANFTLLSGDISLRTSTIADIVNINTHYDEERQKMKEEMGIHE